jgi:hypothetical protein
VSSRRCVRCNSRSKIASATPTTTGKIQRFHRTLRDEFLRARTFSSLERAQGELEEWIDDYNVRRPQHVLRNPRPAPECAFRQGRGLEPDILRVHESNYDCVYGANNWCQEIDSLSLPQVWDRVESATSKENGNSKRGTHL